MKALVITDDKKLQFQIDYDVPREIPKGYALIKTIRAGICSTDLQIIQGYSNFKGIFGHEFVGRIIKMNDNDNPAIAINQRVVGEINLPCGNCSVCKEKNVLSRNHCPNRTTMGIDKCNGTFAEYILLPCKNLYAVDDCISDIEAVFVEPLAAAYRIVEQNIIESGERIAVIGDGKLGLLIAEVLYAEMSKNNTIVVIGKHEEKLNLLPKSIHTIIANQCDNLNNLDDQLQFDCCVEATGNSSGLNLAIKLTKPMGKIILKSTFVSSNKEEDFNTTPIVVKELTIYGSRCGNFPMALNALKNKSIDVRKYFACEYPIDRGMEAIEKANNGLKVHLTF